MKWKVGEEKVPEVVIEEYTLPDDGRFWECIAHKVLFGPGEKVLRIEPAPSYDSGLKCPIIEKRRGFVFSVLKPCGHSLYYGGWDYFKKYELTEIK